jgi:hypothetical protein
MDRQPVTSSNVDEVGYDEKTQTLEVCFNSGAVYRYKKVPAAVIQELMAAPSVGRFMTQRIKGVYECEKVEE